ncbi:TlpA family protein disulfide reductase [Arcobacter ellisii]|jgi:thiol-disulfide isomerase/thioredoxin|uniref:Protein disulfide reductase, TlpA family n=1 Tax=Arcobacter ellisii TaxID=913109 RepID=A0A347U8X1_9BACT|nr:TlpA disulfide reductase family protein [Arcobacter ellisii]AXX95299.1 protein disulfide reductase, TlpA family [Arcobacter ellisii]RXI29570.1 thioredoxin [Arcobacter ellisii]
MKNRYLLLLLLLLFAGCEGDKAKLIKQNDEKNSTELKKEENKTYNLKTIYGENIKLTLNNNILIADKIENKMVLINFWATWCPPCIKEIPVFNELYEKYKDNFIIIGVLYEKNIDANTITNFIKENNIKFPITISEDENFRMAKELGDVKKIPESFLYSKEGFFIEKYVGIVNEKKLIEHIENNIK